MSQIRDKKAHRKHIATMNPINAKSVQLIELHAFAYRLLSVYLSESFDFLKIRILNIFFVIRRRTLISLLSCTCTRTGLSATLCTTLSIHFSAGSLECCIQFSHGSINSRQILCFMSIFQFLKSSSIGAFLSAGNLSPNSFN